MFIQTENGLQGGRYDIICILHDIDNKRYHAALFEENPLPGSFEDNEKRDFIRLKSKMHHTTGSDTLEGAKQHVEELKEKVKLPESNIWNNNPIDWDGEIGTVFAVSKDRFES